MELVIKEHIRDIKDYMNKIYQDINVHVRKEFALKASENVEVRMIPDWETALLNGTEVTNAIAIDVLDEAIQNLIIGIIDEAGIDYTIIQASKLHSQMISNSTGIHVRLCCVFMGPTFESFITCKVEERHDFINLYAIIWDILEWTDRLIAELTS